MPDDGTDWEDQEELPGRPFGTKPFGTKPFGTKPFGTKPFGTKPFGTKPFGTKPFGTKPFGTKPLGASDGRFLDPEEWGIAIAELVCERSAVIRLGATLVISDQERVPVPTFKRQAGIRAAGAEDATPGRQEEVRDLRPGEWELSASVAVSARVLGALATTPEVAYTVMGHLAEGLADFADTAFLQKGGTPKGIAGLVGTTKFRVDRLQDARELVQRVREEPNPFRNPGWILAPMTLNELTRLKTGDGWTAGEGRTLDTHELLRLDGIDGGVFLGYPFLLSAAAGPYIYFAADWQEAWIGLEEPVVRVWTEPDSGEKTVFKASMPLDFVLRDKGGFAALGPNDVSEPRASATE